MEIANDARSFAYGQFYGMPNSTFSSGCPCEAYDEGYVDIVSDPAPWYDATRPDSEDFLGFYAHSIEEDTVQGRTVVAGGGVGSSVMPERLRHRNLFFSGLMLATSERGMNYGRSWLREALRGNCANDGTASDQLLVLPSCPPPEDMAYDDATPWFRTLYNVGLVDGPVYQKSGNAPWWYIQEAAFTLTAGIPWLYHDETRVLDAVDITAGTQNAALTTPDWMGEGTFTIDIKSPSAGSGATAITITGGISLDGSCPRGELADDTMPCFSYTIPAMAPGDRIVIDGVRREVRWYGAAAKYPMGGLRYIEWEGPWVWPDVSAACTVCVAIAGTGDALATVDTQLREV